MADFLVLQLARFGDIVQTKRLIRSLEQSGRVHLAVDQSLSPLAALLYPGAEIYGLQVHGSPNNDALSRNRDIFQSWRSIRFQSVYNCNFSGISAAICRLFEPESIVGYRPAHASQGGMTRSPWARLVFRLTGARIESPLNLVDFWAHFAPSPLAGDAVNPPAKAGGQGLGIVLAGRESRRSLPIPLLAKITEIFWRLLDGPEIRLLGTMSEQPAARGLLRALPAKVSRSVVNLSGKTDWQGLTEAVNGLDALITPDTGVMHLGAHLGVPVRAFFLSSAWCHETGPYGLGHMVWQCAPNCAPCLESAPCSQSMACLAPFSDAAFPRALALTARGGDLPENAALPGNLQIWRSGFDALGGLFHRCAGMDPHGKRRTANRALLAAFLGLPTCPGHGISEAIATSEDFLAGYGLLYRDTDWMLPPWRYC